MKSKQDLRIEYKSKRLELKKEFIENKSDELSQKCIQYLKNKNKIHLIGFMPILNEPNLTDVYNFWLNKKEKLYFPKYKDNQYIISRVNSLEDLEKGKYNIFEPKQTKDQLTNNQNEIIWIVPGLVFDQKGNRIGYGKGVYDNLLKIYPGMTIGLCYKFQLLNQIPADTHDVKLKKIIYA